MTAIRRVSILLVSITLLTGVFMLRAPVSSASDENCNEAQSTTLTKEAPISTKYAVWILARSAENDTKAYLQVGDKSCHEIGLAHGEEWQWVSGRSGTIVEDIQAGSQNFSLSISKGSIEVDKVLVTSELGCTPLEFGFNCIEVPLDFAIRGIAANETISEERVISAALVNKELKNSEFSFEFDDTAETSVRSEEPYCYRMQEAECGAYALTNLKEGRRSLKVAAKTLAGQQKTIELPFTVSKTPVVNASATPNPSGDLPPIDFEITGISDKETIRGGVVVAARTSHSSPVTMVYRLDDKTIATRSLNTFCLVDAVDLNGCAEWDTTAIVDGTYTLSVLAVSEGYKDTQKSVDITVSNGLVQNESQEARTDSAVVIGNGKQQATGVVELRVNADFVKRTSVITYKVGDDVAAVTSPESPFSHVDTSTYVNGDYTISASVTDPDGSMTTVSSLVTIKNTWQTSFVNWIYKHKLLVTLIAAVISLCVFVVVFVTSRLIKHKKFLKSHSLADYHAQTEEILFKYFNRMKHVKLRHGFLYGGAASLIVLISFATFVLTNKPTVQARGLGFVLEIQNGVTSDNSEFKLIKDMAQNKVTVLLKSPDSDVQPENAHDINSHNPGQQTPGGSSGTPSPGAGTGGTGGGTPAPGGGSGGSQTPPPAPSQCTPGRYALTQHGPCIINSYIPPAVQGLATQRIDQNSPITSNAGEPGAFRHRCDFSHMNYDDAVLFRNQVNAAHLHTYFGNTGANAYSTSASLLGSGNSTCGGGTFNRSAYWVPSMIDTASGRPMRPSDPRTVWHSDLEVYYKLGYQGIGYQDVRAFPNGLQMIAGNPSNATTPTAGSHVEYWCENNSQMDRINRGFGIPVCNQGQILTMAISFPQCWDGVNLTTPNGRSHLRYGTWQPGYPTTSIGCPSSHPVGLPFIEMFVRYHVASGNTANWRLSSDNYTNGPGGYSGHADYVFAWQDGAFQTVVDRCYRTLYDCYYQLGDGRDPRSPRY